MNQNEETEHINKNKFKASVTKPEEAFNHHQPLNLSTKNQSYNYDQTLNSNHASVSEIEYTRRESPYNVNETQQFDAVNQQQSLINSTSNNYVSDLNYTTDTSRICHDQVNFNNSVLPHNFNTAFNLENQQDLIAERNILQTNIFPNENYRYEEWHQYFSNMRRNLEQMQISDSLREQEISIFGSALNFRPNSFHPTREPSNLFEIYDPFSVTQLEIDNIRREYQLRICDSILQHHHHQEQLHWACNPSPIHQNFASKFYHFPNNDVLNDLNYQNSASNSNANDTIPQAYQMNSSTEPISRNSNQTQIQNFSFNKQRFQTQNNHKLQPFCPRLQSAKHCQFPKYNSNQNPNLITNSPTHNRHNLLTNDRPTSIQTIPNSSIVTTSNINFPQQNQKMLYTFKKKSNEFNQCQSKNLSFQKRFNKKTSQLNSDDQQVLTTFNQNPFNMKHSSNTLYSSNKLANVSESSSHIPMQTNNEYKLTAAVSLIKETKLSEKKLEPVKVICEKYSLKRNLVPNNDLTHENQQQPGPSGTNQTENKRNSKQFFYPKYLKKFKYFEQISDEDSTE